ncbi:hypothetical protein GCM10010174_50210 [Kutzneria viridogrisea]|uniref:DNA-binding transcriptional ArsR family regulator n=1 Tax=Kutzneria viridogrisea TaxID=47990 RepID=A0ABR6B8I0_9PSEU|nr:DNA-binding transcriptional ArsR family regulator [Kutzneria viridogrisea]
MVRIHFTAEDLGRITLRVTLGPLAQSLLALGALGRSGVAPHGPWRSRVTAQLRGQPALAGLLTAGPVDGLPVLLEDPARSAALLGLWRVAVAPYWDRMAGQLTAECAVRGRAAMSEGVPALLSTLHTRIEWSAPVLELPGQDLTVRLRGRGLVLCPSLFPLPSGGLFLDGDRPALLFAAPPDRAAAEWIFGAAAEGPGALGSLVGHTRAAVLRELTATRSTGELAERLGISPAGASQHTTVLRHSGLIATRRVRNRVLHSLTPLGQALLRGRSWTTAPAHRVHTASADQPR